MDLNIRLLCVGTFLLAEYFGLARGVTHKCVPGRYQNPIVWVRPGHPVVLTSPPNFQVTSTEILSCIWEVRPEWGTKLVMKVNEKDIDYDCNANKLSIKSEKGTFDYLSECGNDTLPSLADSVMDDGPIIVDFQSSNNDQGKVEFSLTFESWNAPEKNNGYDVIANNCSKGACCVGEDCCVLGVNPAKPLIVGESIQDIETELIKDRGELLASEQKYNWNRLLNGYYMAPGNQDNMSCTVKLVAQPGFQISINFKKMDMLEGTAGGCDEDYVHIYENVDTTTFGVFGKTGLKFCGQHLPNSPAPSIFVSSKNEIYVKYRTDEKKKKRGMGFEMKVTAINPLVTPMFFSHKYGERTCWDQCEETPPPTQPPPTTTTPEPEQCKPLFNKIFISNATNPHPVVSGAQVNFVLKSDSRAAEFGDVSDTSGLVRFSEDPKVQPRLESGKTYAVNIKTNNFLEKTVNVHLHCEPRKDNELCPHCYFSELVPRTTAAPEITSPKAESTTSGTGTPPTGAPGKTTTGAIGALGVKTTKKGATTPRVQPGKTTERAPKKTTGKPGESTEKPTEKPGEKTPVQGTSEATTPPGAGTKGIATTPQAVVPTTTSIYRKEKYPKCGEKDFVNPQNQAICDCTEDRCDQVKKRETGKCEPCIDIPLVELITTTSTTQTTTTCEGTNCTTPPSTTPPPTTTPCPAAMDKNVKVTVIDKVKQVVLDQVNVTLKQTHPKYGFVANDFTKSDGVVTIEINEDGNFTVILKKPGYEDSEKDVTINCDEEHGCVCSVDITANLTKIDPCKEGSSIEVKVRKYVGTSKSRGGGNTEDVINFGAGEKDTKITLNGINNKNVTGVFNETSKYVVFDVTGGVPDDYTIEVKDVGVDTGKVYKPSSEIIEFKMCEYSSTMPEDCCKKQHEIIVDFVPPTTTTVTTPATTVTTTPCTGSDCTTVTTTQPTTTTPCPYQTTDTLHVSFCGDTSYKQFGEPTVTFTDRGTIIGQTKLGSIVRGELKASNCTGEYSDKLLINEYEPVLINTRISTGKMKIEVKGKNFETTSNEITMDCTSVQGCNNCTERLQVLVKPKICTKEFFTITVMDDKDPVEGATVIAKNTDGTVILTKETDEKGLLKINFDRTMEKLKLTISKKGYKTVNTEGLLACKLKACGECNPKLEKEIKPEETCKTPMKIFVTIEEDESGNPVRGAKVVVTRKSDDKVITKDDDYTNEKGEASITVPTNGEFRVDITPKSHLPKTKDVIVKECNTTNVTAKVRPNPSTTSPLSTPLSTTPCVYNQQDVKIHFKVLDISLTKQGKPLDLSDAKITVHFIEGTGQQKNEVLITEREKTDKLGELKVPASTNGNYSYSISKAGFIDDPKVGSIMVDCDCINKTACEPVETLELEAKICDPVEYPKNFYVNVTSYNDHKSVPGAEVTLTLKIYRNTLISNRIGNPQTTPPNGIVSFQSKLSGIYWLDVKLTNYITYTKEINLTCNVEECQTCNQTYIVDLRKEGCPAELKVVVKTSTNNKIVEGATVTATRDGISNGVTKHIITTQTNASGVAMIPLNDNGMYNFEVEAKDHIKFTGKHFVNLTANSQECEAYFPVVDTPITPNNICTNGVRLSLTWGSQPVDLDLYTFRVLNSDSSQYCQTYWCDKKEQCGCTYFDTDNLYKGDRGAETITLCCEDIYSYMLYVDDRTGNGQYLPGSEASIHLQSNIKYAKKTLERPSVASTTNKRYWIAGCLTTGSGDFHYMPVNQFTETQPSSGEPLLCHNLIETYKEEEKRAEFPNNVKLSVTALDMDTHNKVADARVMVTPVRNRKIVAQESTTPSSTGRSDAAVYFSIGENGEYKITAEKEGYTVTPIFVEFMCNKTNCNIPALTTYFLKKLPVGDLRISLTYQRKTDFYLDLVQVDKQNTQEVCVALKKYNTATKNVDCPKVDLEWTSSPSFEGNGEGNGDSFVLKEASSNAKYTYLIYIDMKTDIPDEYTYLTLSDSNQDHSIKVLPPDHFVKDEFYIAGCLEISGTSYNFVPKGTWTTKNPNSDGRLMCHDEFTRKDRPAIWSVRDTFCDSAKLTVIAKDTNGKEISESNITTTFVDNLKLDPRKHPIYPSGPINQLKATELIGNGVYTTKIEADGYVTDSVDRIVTCDIEKCSKCTPKTVIIMANKTQVESGAIILSVTSQTGAVLKFVVYDGEDVSMTKNDEGNVISIPYGTKEATVTLAVAKAITETGKLSDTDAVFTLRYGDSLIKLKIPTDRYNGEKHWLIGSLKIKENKEVEFFSDNFYANALEVFESIKDRRKIGLTLPAAPAPLVATDGNPNGIPRCPEYTGGDMIGGDEKIMEEVLTTAAECEKACKAKYAKSIGVTVSVNRQSEFSCYCEFGDPSKASVDKTMIDGWETCLF